MQEFIEVNDVPIMDEWDDFPEEKLHEIIDVNNKRAQDTGDLIPLVIGHNKPNQKEIDGPEIVGYACNLKLGKIGKLNPRPAILAKFKFFKEKFELAKKFPRRSIELWKDDLVLDPIALLGPTTPERDLGLVYSKNGNREKYSYEFSDMDAKYPNEEQISEVLKVLQNTDVWKFMEKQMHEHTEPAVNPEMTQPEAQGEEAVKEASATMYSHADQHWKDTENHHLYEHAKALHDHLHGEQHEKSLSNSEDTVEKEEPKEEKIKMERDQARREKAKYEKAYHEMESRLQQLEKRNRSSERKADLLGLEGEGISFDMAEELELVSDMEVAQYEKHKEHMRKRYARAPIGVTPVTTYAKQNDGTVADKGMTKDAATKIIDYAYAKNVSFEQAVKELNINL